MSRGALDQIADGYAASAASAGPPLPPDDDPGGLGASIGAQLVATFGRVAQALDAQARDLERRRQAIRQVPIQMQEIPLSGGGGTLDVPDAYMLAKTGYNASIRRLSAWGFSAGSVSVYSASAAGELLAPFPSAGVITAGRGELLLQPGDRIVFIASGITGNVLVGGSYDLFETWYLPYYIG
jgi:hypothetical protein